MLKELLFSATQIPLLKKGLDAYALRHRVQAGNIANAETPRYQRRSVAFEEKLQEAIRQREMVLTNSRHLRSVGAILNVLEPEVQIDQAPSDPGQVNNVDIDLEMAELAKTNLQFGAAAQTARMHFALLNAAIRGM